MSDRWPGGIVRATPVTPTGPSQTGTAPGVWTMEQAAYWQKQGLWPTAGFLNYWIGTQNTGAIRALATDSSGNSYYFTETGNGTITKYGPFGNLIWAKQFSAAGAISGAVVDGAGDLYICGSLNNARFEFYIAKLTSAGAISWQTIASTSYGGQAYGIALASSGNLYVVGYMGTATNPDAVTIKLNSSGSVQWQRYSYSAQYDYFVGVGVDSSENVYVAGYSGNAGSPQRMQVVKYNSSGTVLVNDGLSTGSSPFFNNTSASKILVTSAGDVYLCGSYGSGATRATIGKFNSSFAFQWGQFLGNGNSGEYDSFYGLGFDPSGNIYAAGQTYSTVGTRGYAGVSIAKYNTSGTLQWQRTIASNKAMYANDVVGTASGMYVAGQQDGGGTNAWTLSALNSGASTGTYSVGGASYYYETSAISSGSISYGSAGYSMTNGTPSYTFNSASFTLSDVSVTVTKTGLA